ncbi:hypothetical protein P7H15_10935 [Paenibacillus larvae]|nr:hypothetical protein [Paenibacillus larvae]MDT2293251.1 hypothetical protein [Paenibacillus larvae]
MNKIAALAEHDARIEAVDQDVKSIREVVALNITNWRKDAANLIKKAHKHKPWADMNISDIYVKRVTVYWMKPWAFLLQHD